jgi:hypothetical protein
MLDIVLSRTALSLSISFSSGFAGLEIMLTVPLIDCGEGESVCQGAAERIGVTRGWESEWFVESQEERCRENDD